MPLYRSDGRGVKNAYFFEVSADGKMIFSEPMMPCSQADRERLSQDLKEYEIHCQRWYSYNYRIGILVASALILSGTLTVAAAVVLPGSQLKYTVVVLGVISALAPAYQKLLRNSHKAEFYARAENDAHGLDLKLTSFSTIEDYLTVLAAYIALRAEESLLSKEVDSVAITAAAQKASEEAVNNFNKRRNGPATNGGNNAQAAGQGG